MANRTRSWRQRDLTAAVKGLTKAGENVTKVEVDPVGKLAIYVGDGNIAVELPNPWKGHLDAQEIAVRSKLRRV